MNDAFCTVSQYLESATDLEIRIQRYKNLIEAFELKIIDSVGRSGIVEMQMDDGQMKVKSTYRSMKDMQAGLLALEQAYQRCVNRYNGRRTVLRGGNF